jgi:U3 small nucleolar RNA-associated protein MPP10
LPALAKAPRQTPHGPTPEATLSPPAPHAARAHREDRKRRRAKRKRQHSAREQQKEAERGARAAAAGGDASIAGRKSLAKQLDDAANAGLITRGGGVPGGASGGGGKKAKGQAAAGGGGGGEGVKYGRSASAFAAIQASRDAGPKGKGAAPARKSAAALKL